MLVRDMDEPPQSPEPTNTPTYGPLWIRGLWLGLGFLFVALGLIGVLLPGLPTTPFLLLAAACFSKSSLRFYNMLLENRWFGQGIRDYRNGLGVPRRIKVFAIGMMWVFVSVAVFLVIPPDQILYRLIIAVAGVIGTIYVASLKTRQASPSPERPLPEVGEHREDTQPPPTKSARHLTPEDRR